MATFGQTVMAIRKIQDREYSQPFDIDLLRAAHVQYSLIKALGHLPYIPGNHRRAGSAFSHDLDLRNRHHESATPLADVSRSTPDFIAQIPRKDQHIVWACLTYPLG
jgi:hypothetical protein